MGRVARQLGYGTESVRSWVKRADIDQGIKPGTTSADAERIKQLEQENRELKRANEILRRASVFFCGGARPPTEMTTQFIDANRAELGVKPICSTLQMAPSTYYAAKSRPPSARSVADAAVTPRLVALHKENYSVYGARKLWKAARRAGYGLGRDRWPGSCGRPA